MHIQNKIDFLCCRQIHLCTVIHYATISKAVSLRNMHRVVLTVYSFYDDN